MADWAAIRQVARQRRAEIIGDAERLVAAETLLARSIQQAGLWASPVAPDDAVLAGAYALLDRESLGILFNADLPPERRRFILAHELAHWWLHDERQELETEEIVEDPLTDPLPFGQTYVSGYSPAQRRETEANVFAAEFLLPAPALRAAFLRGLTAQDIAHAAGVSEAAVLGQMTEALLGVGGSASGVRAKASTPNAPEREQAGRSVPTPSLDESQRIAAEIERGPVLINAGPGTGKTRTLIARILYLLHVRGVAPENILTLTFSNKATNEMRERLEMAVPAAARRVRVFTFHGFGLELLRRFGTRIGLPPSPALIDPIDAVALLEENLARLNLREYQYLHNPAYPFPDMLSAISRAKDELASPERYDALAAQMEAAATDEHAHREAAKAREVAQVYRVWQEILQERGMLDFGDLIYRSVELLQTCPDVLEQVRSEYRQILVDEYQDINRASAVLVKCLAGEGEGLWAVGDLRQAIYRFRGASAANVENFEKDYPTGRRLSLDVNYRSRPPLVEIFSVTAQTLTFQAAASAETEGWHAARDAHTDALIIARADNEAAQADGIAATIRRFQEEGIPLAEQAILCRTNAQAEALSAALEARGIPVLYLGDLFARPEVRDMLALLALTCGSEDHRIRVSRFPEYQGDSDSPRLQAHLADIAQRPGSAYTTLTRYLFGRADYLRRLLREESVSNRQCRLALYQLLMLARAHANLPGPSLSLPPSEEGEAEPPDAGAKIEERTPSSGAFEEHPHRAFLAYVRRLLTLQEDTRLRLPASAEDIEAVRLMTVHSAKGLEFSVVFVPNLTRDMFPPRKRGGMVRLPPGLLPDEENGIDSGLSHEEQSLFFVAISRARDHLILSYPQRVGNRARAASPLFMIMEKMVAGREVERVEWRASPSEAAESVRSEEEAFVADHGPENRKVFPLHHVEQYMRCPRQYYYARILNLQGMTEESAYRAYQRCVRSVVHWIEEEQAAGRSVEREEVERKLDEFWQEAVPQDQPHASLLRPFAEQIAAQHLETWKQRTSVPSRIMQGAESEITAALSAGNIALRLDHAEETEEGSLLVERYDTGRPSEDDHTAPRLALIRHGIKQRSGRPVQIRLRYLLTGETKPVPEQPRYEPARLAKYEAALQGMRSGRFEPLPSQECASCPFFFLCPV